MKKIVVTIDREGKTSVEAVGFKGKGCVKATEVIAKILGRESSRQKKAEYYETESISQS